MRIPNKSVEQTWMKKKRNRNMMIPTLIMSALAIVLVSLGYLKGEGQHITGLQAGLKMTVTVFPLLITAFVVAGMVQVLMPAEMISRWVGTESGIRGILIGTITGAIAPGGPYVSLPLAAALLNAGAGMGTMVAFLTGWSLLAVSRLPLDIGILGWRLTLVRLASTFFFPPIAGLIAHYLFGHK